MDDENSDEELVMSEVHLGCPSGFSGPFVSRFAISLPSDTVTSRCVSGFQGELLTGNRIIGSDEDGDLVLPRRNVEKTDVEPLYHSCTVTIQHDITSTIPNVGLQVWKAELVLSDFVLHKALTSSAFDGIVALELGAGTGLVGILLARAAKTVFITDKGDHILDNCAKNIALNSRLLSPGAAVHVKELDWTKPWPPKQTEREYPPSNRYAKRFLGPDLIMEENCRYSWASSEVEEAQGASLLLAADVIYSDDLTDAFFSIVERFMSQNSEKVLYLALEKRYNFTLDDFDVVANGYSHFLSYLNHDDENGRPEHESETHLVGSQIDLSNIPQYVGSYERGRDVEIWQIRYCKK